MIRSAIGVVVVSLALASCMAPPATAGTTERVSISTAGEQGNNDSFMPCISADGRFVAFASWATNLVPDDTNGMYDAFVRDRLTGATERVSISTEGVQGNSDSYAYCISADGRFVGFYSRATNLVPGDTNGTGDAFVRDRLTATTERVSISTAGEQGNGYSAPVAISADGRFVAIWSGGTNLVPDDTNGWEDVFVRDRLAGTTERVSVSTAGEQGNGYSQSRGYMSMSADGRFVAFESTATNLVPDDTNGCYDVFVRDRLAGTTERVSISTAGEQGNENSDAPCLSADGRFVGFYSQATNLVPGDTTEGWDVFVHDRLAGTTERISITTAGEQANDLSSWPCLSADGRFVAFPSRASNLVADDSNLVWDVFVRDRVAATTRRVSVSTNCRQATDRLYTNTSAITSISADGGLVAFASLASNLVPGDTNAHFDVFVRDISDPPCPEVTYDCPPTQAAPYPLVIRQLTSWPDTSRGSNASAINHDGTRVAGESSANLTGENSTGYNEVVAMNGDGTGLRQLTHGARGAAALFMSGNGEMLAFGAPGNLTGQNSDGSREIFVVSFDGTITRQLTFNPNAAYSFSGTRLSYDGQWVVFSGNGDLTGENTDHSYEIFVVRSDGTGLMQLTHESNPAYGVTGGTCFSPDGQKVAFGSTSDFLGINPDHSCEIFIINRDGTGLAQVTSNPDPSTYFYIGYGITSDGATLLIYGTANPTGQNPDGHSEIFMVNSNGTNLRQLTCDPEFDSTMGNMSYDGALVTFRSYADFTGQNPDHSHEVFAMRDVGARLTQVSRYDGPGTGYCLDRPSGDGRHIAFTSNGNQTGGNPDLSQEGFIADIAQVVQASDAQGVPGNGVSVPVTVEDTDGVAGAQFDLVYDPAILTNPGAQKGALISGDPNWTISSNVISAGRLRVIAYSTLGQPLGPGSGEIAECTFTVSPSATRGQTSPLDVQNPVLSDQHGGSIPAVDVDGTFTVIAAHHFVFDPIPTPQGGDAAYPLPFTITVRAMDQNNQPATQYNEFARLSDLTATFDLDLNTIEPDLTAAFSAGVFTGQVGIRQPISLDHITAVDWLDPSITGVSNDFVVIGKGDPTGDGQANVLDVVKSVNIALGLYPCDVHPAECWAADMNRDGVVNVLDVIRIQNMALGLGSAQGTTAMTAARAAAPTASSAKIAASVVKAGVSPVPTAKKMAVPVLIDKAKGVAGFNFDLMYDGRALTPIEVRAGTLIAGKPDWLLNANLAKNPLKVLAFSNQAKALTGGSGTLVEVVFAQTGKLGNNSLRLGTVVASDRAGDALSRTIDLGKSRPMK